MLTIPIQKMNEREILRLKDNSIPEGKILDYKEIIKLDQSKDKKEFLADISSFANTNGGYIIWGITEKNGIPTDINGVEILSIDDLLQQIESIIRDGLEPRISYELKIVELGNGKKIIIAYIYESWNKPHMVTLAGHGKFYARSNSGKYPLSVDELKTIIIHSQLLADKIRKFRFERISLIKNGETPIPYNKKGKFILHVIPAQSFSSPYTRVDISTLKDLQFRTLNHYNESPKDKINIDGLLRYDYLGDDYNPYVQVFRNGIIECVSEALMQVKNYSILYPTNLEISIKDNFSSLLEILRVNEFLPPIYIFLSLLDVHNAVYPLDDYGGRYSSPIGRDVLLLSECVANSYDDKILHIFKPAFDELWNALGILKSPNIDTHGNWKPPNKK